MDVKQGLDVYQSFPNRVFEQTLQKRCTNGFGDVILETRNKQDRQCPCDVTLRCVRVTIVVVEEQ